MKQNEAIGRKSGHENDKTREKFARSRQKVDTIWAENMRSGGILAHFLAKSWG